MKKTYIAPATQLVKAHTTSSILLGSQNGYASAETDTKQGPTADITINDDEEDESDAKEFVMPKYSLWDED